MTNNSIVRSDKYYIHSYEVDLTTRLRFASLNRYMQESAWKSAEQLGFGFSRLIKRNLAWVLTRMTVSIDYLPGWNKSINIATWPSGRDAMFGFRDFQFFDAEGKEFGRAATSWCIIDLKTRKPVLIHSAFEEELAELNRRMFPARPSKVEALKQIDSEWKTVVGYQDLDVNEHVTNSRYIDWLLESFDLQFLRNHRVANLEINFLAEALYKHAVVVRTEKISATEYRHSIVQTKDDLEISRAKTLWR